MYPAIQSSQSRPAHTTCAGRTIYMEKSQLYRSVDRPTNSIASHLFLYSFCLLKSLVAQIHQFCAPFVRTQTKSRETALCSEKSKLLHCGKCTNWRKKCGYYDNRSENAFQLISLCEENASNSTIDFVRFSFLFILIAITFDIGWRLLVENGEQYAKYWPR